MLPRGYKAATSLRLGVRHLLFMRGWPSLAADSPLKPLAGRSDQGMASAPMPKFGIEKFEVCNNRLEN
ncbi:hypothetical protein NL676_002074 [Syzygium grande]|nr:hypothetical protein NL676_002074 [Syzygium grande]